MIPVISLILKIIGILILSVLGLLILGMILIFFVPVRYQLKGYYHNDYLIDIRISWLLKIVRLSFTQTSNTPGKFKISILGMEIKERKNRHNSETIQNNKKKDKRQTENHIEANSDTEVQEQENLTAELQMEEVKQENLPENEIPSIPEQKQDFISKIKSLFANFFRQIINIKYEIMHLCDIMQKICSQIRKYIDILNSDDFHNAVYKSKRQLKRIFRNMKPRKMNITINYGDSEHPDSVGSFLAVWGMLYPLHQGNIALFTSFDTDLFEVDFFIKGRISCYIHLRTLYLILFDKNIKHLKELVTQEV